MHHSGRSPLTLAAVLAAAMALPTAARSQSAGSHAAHGAPPAGDAGLGAVEFPTSAAPAARAEFTRGVLQLHNFHYPLAVAAFQRARALDPRDAMSAAFEALAHTHPVWNQQDTVAALAALRRLAPTHAARLALARTARERGWVAAVEALYGTDAPAPRPKPARDTAFMRAMAALHASDPRDPEAASFYALALLGLNQGDREPAAYAGAEAIADTVLRAHPRHPGALHYKIHAVDDPPNAARGLEAARVYAEVAPRAAHAQHMTSHIFIALGMWEAVERANRRAQATYGRSARVYGHGTHWLAYALRQQGRVREAGAWVDSMLAYQRDAAAGATPAVRGQSDAAAHAAGMAAAHVVDGAGWDTPLARWRADTVHLRSVAGLGAADFLVGYAAARRAGRRVDVTPGSRDADRRLADSMLARLVARSSRARATRSADQPSALGEADVMAQVLAAELAWGAGRRDSAVATLRRAGAAWEALPFQFGPPGVPKPPRERAAEMLLFMGRPADALAEVGLAERMTPGRTQLALVRARALAALGRRDEARRAYAALDSVWRSADATLPDREEARVGSGAFAAALGGAPVTVDTVTYASGALRLRGVVYAPTGAGRRPAVVALHGSTTCWSDVDNELLGRLFASRGYVAFLPCRRGLGLSEGQGVAVLEELRREGLTERDSAFASRSTALLAGTQLDDVLGALAAVRARRDVDPRRVAVTGVSYGGILTLLAAERDPTLRAAVAFAPAAMNWGWNTPLRARLLDAARRTRVPSLVVQAENDFHTGPVRELPAALRAGGGDATGRVYPAVGGNVGAGHGLMTLAPALWEADVLAFLDARLSGGAR